ncbi:UNVERIFIED_CONTAM: Retrovirus-related Pol polyprotein from transposon TNT 1-94 [Sesamum radiatum]|uniref:Retrovirus-related Pol polyprotein from transposon TNT 1-94 n=1 Tax=Sesamum radiatum TaxID=300843 RepID=A0AAW2UA39_SESRA
MKIMKGSLTVFKAEKRRNLYFCHVEYDLLAASAKHSEISDLWHKRLGHMSVKGLDLLHKQGMLKEKCDDMSFCDDCILGKHHKVQFPSSSSQKPSSSLCILDYVHADVWGPANVPTHGGNRYFLSIIDNYSRKVFVFLMKHKSEVFEKFKNWKTLVETKTSKTLKALRTDNGLEFCNQQFSDLCDEFGIKRHRTTPYTPQQNGVAERMNRTLLNKVRYLLISSDLSKSFWGDALMTAAYLINRSPSVPLSGYRLWVRSQPGLKIITSRDVTFNELEMPCLSDTSKKEIDFNIENTFIKIDLNPQDNQQGEEIEEEENQPRNTTRDDTEHHNNDYQLARDSVRRETRIPSRFRDFDLALNVEDLEPLSYEEALGSKNSEQWKQAMHEEIESLRKIILGPSLTLITELQNNLKKNFEMKDLGNAKKILGMSIERDRNSSTIFLNQSSYVKNI